MKKVVGTIRDKELDMGKLSVSEAKGVRKFFAWLGIGLIWYGTSFWVALGVLLTVVFSQLVITEREVEE
jgi:hypothetical protein